MIQSKTHYFQKRALPPHCVPMSKVIPQNNSHFYYKPQSRQKLSPGNHLPFGIHVSQWKLECVPEYYSLVHNILQLNGFLVLIQYLIVLQINDLT